VTDTEVAGVDVQVREILLRHRLGSSREGWHCLIFICCDYQGGITSTIEDLGNINYKVWGTLKKSFGDFALSGRADVDSKDTDSVGIILRIEGQGLMAQTSATAGMPIEET
jgi:hypothetical protein